jgi:hypothetical protein
MDIRLGDLVQLDASTGFEDLRPMIVIAIMPAARVAFSMHDKTSSLYICHLLAHNRIIERYHFTIKKLD